MAHAIHIASGSVRVRIFRNDSRAPSGKVYQRWEIRHTDLNGHRRRTKRASLAKARAEARRIADDLARAHPHSELTQAQIASFKAGVHNLRWTGRSIEMVTADCAEAIGRLRAAGIRAEDEPSLDTLARFYVEHRPRAVIDLPVAELVEKFLLTKKEQGVSERWQSTLANQLKRFAKDLPVRAGELTAEMVQRWYLGLKVAPVTRNNFLAAVHNLFTFPALRNHAERQAILDLPFCKAAPAANAIWTPEEFAKLLETARLPFRVFNRRTRREETRSLAHLIPVLALGGFCKMRNSEIARVEVHQLRLDEARLKHTVRLRRGQTKTDRAREVPMPDCAVSWLRLCDLAPGRVWPWSVSKLNSDLRALAARCALAWRDNALRNSAVTYAQVLDPDLARVSREAGNSPAILESEYLNDAVTLKTARAWFAIAPARDDAKIVALAVHK